MNQFSLAIDTIPSDSFSRHIVFASFPECAFAVYRVFRLLVLGLKVYAYVALQTYARCLVSVHVCGLYYPTSPSNLTCIHIAHSCVS